MFCIPQELVQLFKEKLKSGEINPEKLSDMTSKERHVFLGEILGESNARSVNALFESKLLLKNQQLGIINWAKKIAGLKPEVLRDLVSKVNRMDKVLEQAELKSFLEDFASQRLGFDITDAEFAKVSELAKDIADKKARVSENSPPRSPERLEYGLSLALFKDYVGKLKLGEKPFKEYLTKPVETLTELAGVTKSLLSTLDNSFFGRQGFKVLFTNPSIWTKNFLKSWGDIARELKGLDAETPIRADVYSRPNAMNGVYERMKLDIGLLGEEAFPSSLPGRIPLLGRLFKASESAFNGAALRMRADLADGVIKLAEESGVSLLDKTQMQDIGKVVNSITGRGSIGRLGVFGKEINAVVFSIRFLKSQLDVLTQPFNPNMSPFARKVAATNLAKIVGGIAVINLVANYLAPGSVEKEYPGRIKVGNTRIDITGGWGSIGRAAYLLQDKLRNQEGKYGERTAMDVVEDFFQGKLSPLAGVARDILKGQNFDREKVTLQNTLPNLVTPLSVQQFQDILKSPDSDKVLQLMILEGLGFGTFTSTPKSKPIKF